MNVKSYRSLLSPISAYANWFFYFFVYTQSTLYIDIILWDIYFNGIYTDLDWALQFASNDKIVCGHMFINKFTRI